MIKRCILLATLALAAGCDTGITIHGHVCAESQSTSGSSGDSCRSVEGAEVGVYCESNGEYDQVDHTDTHKTDVTGRVDVSEIGARPQLDCILRIEKRGFEHVTLEVSDVCQERVSPLARPDECAEMKFDAVLKPKAEASETGSATQTGASSDGPSRDGRRDDDMAKPTR